MKRQLNRMARIAKAQGDIEAARQLRRVAKWRATFGGQFWACPHIGPSVPFIGGLHSSATGEALRRASERGAPDYAAMIAVWRGA